MTDTAQREASHGLFIVIEGLDGSGTTTQAAKLVERIRNDGRRVVATREPTDRPIGSMIREILRTADSAVPAPSLALLFAADRLDHVENIVLPATRSGADVVSDRYVHSSLAYQSSENPAAWVERINERAPAPDLVVFLDVPVDVCLARIAARGEARERYEDAERLQAIAARYEDALARRPTGVERVDGELAPDAVHEAITQLVAAYRRRSAPS